MSFEELVRKAHANQPDINSLSPGNIAAMYEKLIETLPAIVYIAEPVPPYATIYVSPNISMLGYTLADWLHRPDMWVHTLHDEDREWVLRQTEAAQAQGGETNYEYRVLTQEGEVRWLHDQGKFVVDDAGQPICWQGLLLDVTARKQAEQERERLIEELQTALAEIKTLSGLLPICSYCKSVRTDRDYWQEIEEYISEHSSAQFSHGICPDCYTKFVQPEMEKLRDSFKK